MNPATITPPTYIPRMGSLADRVLAYFQQQPFEELRQADVATKFEVSRGSVSSSLKQAIDTGKLVYAQNDDMEYVYTLAVNEGARPAAAPSLFTAGTRTNSRHKTVLKVTESQLMALKVEVGVPVHTGKGAAGMSKWQPIFDKLTEPDTSLAFPLSWKSAVAADATKRNMAAKKTAGLPTYRVAIVSETQARIWRTI